MCKNKRINLVDFLRMPLIPLLHFGISTAVLQRELVVDAVTHSETDMLVDGYVVNETLPI